MNHIEIFEFIDRQERMAKARQQKQKADAAAVGAWFEKLRFQSALKKLGENAVSGAIDTAITVFGYFGVKVPDLRKLVRRLENVILMIAIYGFVRQQTLTFKDLDHATMDGAKLMKDIRVRAPALRSALITILVNIDYDAAIRFVNDLTATIPKEFWDMQWAIK